MPSARRIILGIVWAAVPCAIGPSAGGQTTRAQLADPGTAAPRDVALMICAHGPKVLRQGLLGSPLARSIQADPTLRLRLGRLFGAIEVASALYAGVPFLKTVDEHVDQVIFLGTDASVERLDKGSGWALLLDVGRSAERVDKLLDERIRPRLRGMSRRASRPFPVSGVAVETYILPGFHWLRLARVDRWLALGTQRSLMSVVRAIRRETPRLADTDAYRRVRDKVIRSTPGSLTFYMNCGEITRRMASRREEGERLRLLRLLGLDRVEGIGGTCRFKRGRVDWEAFAYSLAPPSGLLGLLAASPASSLCGAAFVPQDYDIVVAVNPGSGETLAKHFWSMIAPVEPAAAASLQQFNGAAHQFGVNMHRQILCRTEGDWFLAARLPGGGWAQAELSTRAVLALEPVLGVKVRQPEQIIHAWETLATAGMVAAQGVRWEAERVDRQKVLVLRANGKPILGTELSMAFVGDTWLMTLSYETMKRALLARRDRKTLADSRGFATVRRCLPERAIAMLYAHVQAEGPAMGGKAVRRPSARPVRARQDIPKLVVDVAAWDVLRAALSRARLGMTLTGGAEGLVLKGCLSDEGPNGQAQRP